MLTCTFCLTPDRVDSIYKMIKEISLSGIGLRVGQFSFTHICVSSVLRRIVIHAAFSQWYTLIFLLVSLGFKL